jgi:hypothetical protein
VQCIDTTFDQASEAGGGSGDQGLCDAGIYMDMITGICYADLTDPSDVGVCTCLAAEKLRVL